MPETLDVAAHGLLAVPPHTLRALRGSSLRDGSAEGALALQEAGYAGGEALWTAFRQWLATRTDLAPEALDVPAFEQRLSEFFAAAGWGRVVIGTLDDVVVTVDAESWGESAPSEGAPYPGCHLTTGAFADLFGRVADAPVAVLEVACRSAGAAHCRFLVGSPAVLARVHAGLEAGQSYEAAVRACA